MSPVTFKIVEHKLLRAEVVEIYEDGILRGVLYPGDDRLPGVRLISAHLAGPPHPSPGVPEAWQFMFARD